MVDTPRGSARARTATSATPKKRSPSPSKDLDARTIRWLLEEDQPAIRYRTLTELLGRKPNDPEARAAKSRIASTGWAADILARRTPGAGWSDGSSPYGPKYVSTNWMMLVLSDLGLGRADPAVRDAAEYWMERMAAKNGGLGGNSKGTPHYCVSANMARAVTRFGYADDSRVRRTLDWLVEIAHPKGGWSCWAPPGTSIPGKR